MCLLPQHDESNNLNRIPATEFLKTGLAGIVRKSSKTYVSHSSMYVQGHIRRAADLQFLGPDAATVNVSIVCEPSDTCYNTICCCYNRKWPGYCDIRRRTCTTGMEYSDLGTSIAVSTLVIEQ